MNKTDIQSLMNPRFEVQISYPGSHFEVGQILECGDSNFGDVNYYKKFPSVFKEIHWTKLREPGIIESVRYVKREDGKCFKVAEPEQDFRIWHNDDEVEFRFVKHQVFQKYIPITKDEYLQKQNK